MAHEERSLVYKQGDLEIHIWGDYRMERLGYTLGARIKTPKGVYYTDRQPALQDPPTVGQFFEFASFLVDRETRMLRL